MKRGTRRVETKSSDLLPKISPLPGAVCAQMKRCGRSNCKCAKGELHGPYYYRFWYERGRQRKKYVKKGDVSDIKAACLLRIEQRKAERTRIQQSNLLAREFKEQTRVLEKAIKEYLNYFKLRSLF
jgi:hypothetical protein